MEGGRLTHPRQCSKGVHCAACAQGCRSQWHVSVGLAHLVSLNFILHSMIYRQHSQNFLNFLNAFKHQYVKTKHQCKLFQLQTMVNPVSNVIHASE